MECLLSHPRTSFKYAQLLSVVGIWCLILHISALTAVSSIGDSFLTVRNLVAQAILHKVSSVIIARFWILLYPNELWLEYMEGKLVGNARSVEFVRIILWVFSQRCMLLFMKAAVNTVYADNEVRTPLMWLRKGDLQTENNTQEDDCEKMLMVSAAKAS